MPKLRVLIEKGKFSLMLSFRDAVGNKSGNVIHIDMLDSVRPKLDFVLYIDLTFLISIFFGLKTDQKR